MTPLILAAVVLTLWLAAACVTVHRVRRRIPPPDAPSDHYAELSARLRVAHERSVDRTAALTRDLERLRRRLPHTDFLSGRLLPRDRDGGAP